MKLIAGLAAVQLVFSGSASRLGSVRGEAGALVALFVLAALWLVERLLFGRGALAAAAALGLGPPALRGGLVAAFLGLGLLLVFPAFAAWRGTTLAFHPGWPGLVPGLFCQAGIAEETLYRGYLFGHLRETRSFWRAAWVSLGPFVAVHVPLFVTLSLPIALASLLLSVVISFPLAHLYELGGRTVWAPAFLHFVVQGAIKVVSAPGEAGAALPIAWMGAAALLPWLVFLVRPASRPALRRV